MISLMIIGRLRGLLEMKIDRVAGQIFGTIEAEVLVQTAARYLQFEGINGPWDYKNQILENHLLELES
jgi:glutamate formiminotransferase